MWAVIYNFLKAAIEEMVIVFLFRLIKIKCHNVYNLVLVLNRYITIGIYYFCKLYQNDTLVHI